MSDAISIHKSRNYAFDGLKLLFILIVVLHHSNFLDSYLFHGHMSVEFFFMTSGYFLMRTAMHNHGISCKDYIRNRLKKIYPHYFFSFLVLFIFLGLFSSYEVNGAFFFKGLTEMLMVQNLGFFSGGFNYPCWYISVLFYAGIVLFFLVRHLPAKVFYIIGTCTSVAVYGYLLFSNNGNIEVWDTVFVFHLPLWRGISGIIFGMLIYVLHQKINFSNCSRFFCALEVLSLITILVLMCISKNLDHFILVAIILLLIAVGNPQSLILRLSKNALVLHGIQYEYAIFLNHVFVTMCFNKVLSIGFNLPLTCKTILLVLAVIIYSMITTKLVNRITRALSNVKIANH